MILPLYKFNKKTYQDVSFAMSRDLHCLTRLLFVHTQLPGVIFLHPLHSREIAGLIIVRVRVRSSFHNNNFTVER